jgi:SAM-dependent methyltransferase
MTDPNALAEKERREIEAWARNSVEHLGSIAAKFAESQAFLVKAGEYRSLFESAGTILEIGGGQGWAAGMVKRLFPNATVYSSDISPHAVAQTPEWERILKVKLDGSFACRSYEVPLPDASVDLVFTFEAAHHFVAHRRTLAELRRILRPGGTALYLREPSCPAWVHGLAHRRVNRNRPEVPEDVLRYREMERLGREAGFKVTVRFDPSLLHRGPAETVYYAVLRKLRFLQGLLPCTADYVFRKPDQAAGGGSETGT